MNKKRNDKESMICLTPKPSHHPSKKAISEITGVSLWPPSSSDLNLLDYTIWSVLENKPNATSLPNIGSLKTAIEDERNKMFETFILKTSKSFRRRVDTIIEKKMAATLSKFTVLCLFSYFVVYFLKL